MYACNAAFVVVPDKLSKLSVLTKYVFCVFESTNGPSAKILSPWCSKACLTICRPAVVDPVVKSPVSAETSTTKSTVNAVTSTPSTSKFWFSEKFPFPPATFEKKEDREKREAKAKAVCSGCPVKIECLEEANEISEPFGVWGGLNEVERKREGIFISN